MCLHQVPKQATAPGADSSVHGPWQEWGAAVPGSWLSPPLGPLQRSSQDSTCPLLRSFFLPPPPRPPPCPGGKQAGLPTGPTRGTHVPCNPAVP